jgi:UDP-galactopyranose mutase
MAPEGRCGDLVVFSQLRWNFLFRRPQQLMSRLARRWNVVFVEEPVCDAAAAAPWLEVVEHEGGPTVLVPHSSVAAPGFHDDQLPQLEPMLARWFDEHALRGSVAWLYTPMALPLLKLLSPRCIVYDCIAELATLRDAPRQLRQRESALMKRADLVLAAGPSLFEARRGRHDNLHCVPSAVDADHFSPQQLRHDGEHALVAAALQADLEGPRLGYFGVIDERLDLPLIERLADAHPTWQLVMVGPVAGLDAQALPRRANIHWFGPQPYARLPHLLNGWDIALLPFVLNPATRSINPTKILEYLASETPVVSSAVPDVVALYGEAVEVAHGHAGFEQCCEKLLTERPAQRARRQVEMMSLVWTSSWQRTADSVHELLLRALATRPSATLLTLPLQTAVGAG